MVGTAVVVPFVGRAAELAAVEECVRSASRGNGASAVVEGEAGIGKSRLLDEGLSVATELGVSVLRAACHELERNRPFGVLADALAIGAASQDGERASIAHLLWGSDVAVADAVVASALTGRSALQYRALESVLALVERLAAAGPLALVLEDLQWADPSTLLAVHTIHRRLSDLAVAIVVTRRLSPSNDGLEHVAAELQSDGGCRIVLGPLDEAEVEAVATSVVGVHPGSGLRAQLERTRGNPLYLIELLRAFADEGTLQVREGLAEVAGGGLPPDLRLTLLRRLSYLSVPALDALRLAAILGTIFDVAHLSQIGAGSAVDLVAPLREALEAGVLEESGNRLAFRHDLIREALYRDLPEPLRASLHRQVGQSLAEAGVAPLIVAEHLALGALPGDGEAVRWLLGAARATMAQAPGSAVELLDRALEIVAAHDPVRPALLVDMVTARLWSGGIVEAEKLSREALAIVREPADQTALRLSLIQSLLSQGKTMEAFGEIQSALAATELTGSAGAQLSAWIAFGHVLTNNLAAGAAAANAALEGARKADDDLAVCMALCARSLLACYELRLTDAIADATAAIERAQRSVDRTASQLHSHMFLAAALIEADQFEEAASAIRVGRHLSDEIGSDWNLPFYHWTAAVANFFAGNWDDAMAEAETGLLLAQEVQSRFGEVGVRCVLSAIAWHRNDLSRAQVLLAQAEAELAVSGPQHRAEWVLWLEALVFESADNDAAALAALGRAWETCVDLGLAWDIPLLGPDLARLCRRAGDRDRARSVAETVEAVAARTGTVSSRGAALRCRGLADDDPVVLGEAVSVLRGGSRPLEGALAAEDAAASLARAGRREEAVEFFEAALSGLERLGAARDVARVTAGLRGLGVRRGRRGGRTGRPAIGWDSLTPTESAVVVLVAEGLANREVADRLYVSHRTVETHLRHVFDKLGVASRRQLKDQAVRRATSSPGRPAGPTSPSGD